MTDFDARRITNILQRNAGYLADKAAHAMSATSAELWGGQYGLQERSLVSHALGYPPDEDEAIKMEAEGFRRLGSVLMVSLLVDEPRLIADDLSWLKCMGIQPGPSGYDPAKVHQIIRIYCDACGHLLDSADCDYIVNMVDRALLLIGEEDSSLK